MAGKCEQGKVKAVDVYFLGELIAWIIPYRGRRPIAALASVKKRLSGFPKKTHLDVDAGISPCFPSEIRGGMSE